MISEEMIQRIYSYPVDRTFLPQGQLDLAQKTTISLYPWRGQFSPGLVGLLLDTYARENSVVLDPFMGGGTTLFQAAERSVECHGAEINPAAIQFAGMARFANADEATRERILTMARELFEKHIGDLLPMSLFKQHEANATVTDVVNAVEQLLRASEDDILLNNLFVTTVMLAMGDGENLEAEVLQRAFHKNISTVKKIPISERPCKVFASDARRLPLSDGSVDLVITSPPYINVFNYHQNYRKAMELMGWKPLEVARSELGSNRKHRMNRFLTVVQYCIDLAEVFIELKRILTPDGVAIFVVGRESNVRGVPFHNSRLLAMIAEGGVGFRLERWQERKFTNRFGGLIYEDLLTLKPHGKALQPQEFSREVGIQALKGALEKAEGEVQENISQAIERSWSIETSPYCLPALTR